MPTIVHWCGCCKLPIHGNPPNDECPRCHYPVEIQKEERFLRRSLQDLHRVATYQRDSLTIRELISQYQARVTLLQQAQETWASATTIATVPDSPVQAQSTTSASTTRPIITATPAPKPSAASIRPASVPVSTTPASIPPPTLQSQPTQTASENSVPMPQPLPQPPRQMFSLRSFLEDQTINIVASLGAFLLLAGSLSFVATTSNLLFSFVVMLLVHIVFGGVGFIAQRFASFRVVSLIYTAIFALLIPLVSFSAYRLAAGSQMTFSPPALVAMVTAYAAIAYGSLAIYQRFSIFSYLALAALSIADLSTAYAFHLGVPWFFCALMVLALLAMLCLPKDNMSASIFDGRLAILREPLTVAMYIWVSLCCLGILFTTLTALASPHPSLPGTSDPEIRFALCAQIGSLLLWHMGMAWRTHKAYWVNATCYLLVALALAFSFAFSLHAEGYALVLIGIAACYHLLARLSPAFIRAFKRQALATNLEVIALVLVVLTPLIGMFDMPSQLHSRTFTGFLAPINTSAALATLIVCAIGLLITLSATAHHTHTQRRPAGAQADACWLLLLSGFVLYWGCGTLLLLLPIHPTQLFLGASLSLMILAFVVRRVYSSIWSTPLEVVAVAGMVLTLYFSLAQPIAILLALLLGFEGVYYALALSQRRPGWLILAMPLACLAALPLFHYQTLLFGLSLGLPLCAALLRTQYRQVFSTHRPEGGRPALMTWEWVLLLQGLLYGVFFMGLEFFMALLTWPTSALNRELHISVPIGLELALLAGVWYLVAVIVRRPIWQAVAMVFATVAVCFPGTTFLFYSWLAPISILISLGVRVRFGRVWSSSFALTAVLATLMVAITGLTQYAQETATWVLLVCAVLYYVAGIISKEPAVTVLTPVIFILALLISPHTFALLTWLAPVSIVCALGTRLLFGRIYSLSLATTALIAITTLGLLGSTSGNPAMLYTTFWLLLLSSALIYIAGLISKEHTSAWLASVYVAWAFALPINTFFVIAWIAPISILLALGVRLVLGRSASLPLVICAIIATLAMGILGAVHGEMATAVWVLLLCAQLFYLGGLVSREPSITWLAPLFTTWSVYYAGTLGDLYRPALVALTFVLLGIASKYVIFFKTKERVWWHNYRLPLYATAMASALLTGLYGSYANVNLPFYTAVPDILMLYSLLAYVVLLNERRVATLWQGLVLGFATWSLLLATEVAACDPASHLCSAAQIQGQGLYLLALTLGLGIIGLITGRLANVFTQQTKNGDGQRSVLALHWNGCWYLASLIGMLIIFAWQQNLASNHYSGITPTLLTLLLALSLVVMLVECVPETLILSSVLTLWIISALPWTNWQQALAYSGLNLFIFAAQWLWHKRTPVTHWLPTRGLSFALSLGGQSLVVCAIIAQGGVDSHYSALAHSGAVSLLALAALVSLTGYIQCSQSWHRWCYYGALMLLTGALSWELIALQQTRFDVLTLPPATGFILIAAFLQRDERLPRQRLGARLCAALGAALLLLPTLWLSFSESNLSPTLLLGGEALVLLLTGIGTRIRVFILSGAALVVIAGTHALFLPTLGLPPSLALAILGLTLLTLATVLSLARHRLRTAWTQWQ